MPSTYVELVGVAGAGKTSITKLLVKETRQRQVAINTRGTFGKGIWLRIRTIYRMALIIASAPEILRLYTYKIRHEYADTPHVHSTRRNLVTRLIVDSAVVQCLLHDNTESLINDEGLIGKLVSLSVLTRLTPAKVEDLAYKLLPTPALLVYVSVPALTALEREHARSVDLPFFRDMTSDLKKDFFYEATRRYVSLSAEKKMARNVKTFSINNAGTLLDLNKEVESVADKFAEAISIWQNGSSRP